MCNSIIIMFILIKVFFLQLLTLKVLTDDGKSKELDINFKQNDYQLKLIRGNIASYNKEYIKLLTGRTFKYNRTCVAGNLSLIFQVDVGNDLEVILQAYRFASNEYRLFPMRFEFNWCNALSKNTFGMTNVKKCGNFSGCPFEKKKLYYTCNFTPDPSQFPPLIPNGEYLMEFQFLYFSKEVCIINIYLEISRPFVGK